MSRIKHFFRSFWPIGILLVVELFLFFTNYQPGTYLMGWDNVMPEFDFKTNSIRNLVGVWQEYRGVGLYDGMSHAASTIHTLILWIFSIIVPQHLLRYLFTFLMHFLGGIGMYLLLKEKHFIHEEKTNFIVSLIGALLYLLCPITIQMFYTPLEAFTVHFASLPWICLTLSQFLAQGSKKSYYWYLLVLVISTAQFFIPTLLLPIGILLTTFILFSNTTKKRILLALGGFLCINLFWLAPLVYGAVQEVHVVPDAKINQMSSNESYLRNVAFGDLQHVLTMQGFPLDFDTTLTATSFPTLMASWKTHWSTVYSTLILWSIILISFVGMGTIFFNRKQKSYELSFVILWCISFFFLANNVWGIREITEMARHVFPTFAEALRFPFTKFSHLFSFAYVVLFALGISRILLLFNLRKIHRSIVLILLIISTIFLSFPAFSGFFFYPQLHVALPTEYQQLFSFMQKQDLNGRIALFPQPDFWSWKKYRYGYQGSGFLWYGVPQPTLDRAFDPWSNKNEAYYWEISRAVYAKDRQAMQAIFDKYAIQYIILDEYQESTSHDRSLFTAEIETLLQELPGITPLQHFGSLIVYTYTSSSIISPVVLGLNLPTVGPYVPYWTDNDQAYKDFGPYLSTANTPDVTYRFPSIFTKRSVEESQSIIASLAPYLRFPPYVFFEASQTGALSEGQAIVCFRRSNDPSGTTFETNNQFPYLRFTSSHNRLCQTIAVPEVWHKEAYVVTITSRHISGQPMTIAYINKTAKHTELQTFLPLDSDWKTTTLFLPPLTSDGKGYDIYLANDHIAGENTINDIASIQFQTLTVPYSTLIQSKTIQNPPVQTAQQLSAPTTISHPNPSFYRIVLDQPPKDATLILSQAFDPGWHAYSIGKRITELPHHVLVNNWANGWTIPTTADSPTQQTIVIFFVPQLLEWFGFLLIPVPFLLMIKKRKGHTP